VNSKDKHNVKYKIETIETKMALFRWYKKYSVNNTELDKHHKTLICIFNRLYDNCLGRKSSKCIEPIIVELICYSGYHFSSEERHMRNIGYKEIYKHILEHRAFTQRILELKHVAEANDPGATKDLIAFLGKWILNHIILEDKKFTT